MRKVRLAAFMVAMLISASQLKAAEFVNGVGIGIQYGGAVGWQGSYISGANRVRLGLGYLGYTLGYDRYLWPKASLGAQFFGNQFVIGGAFNVNYHFGPEPGTGLVLGLDLYRGVDTAESFLDVFTGLFDFDGTFDDLRIEEKPENGVFVSVGYHF